MIIIVTGGRDFQDRSFVHRVLNGMLPVSLLVQGGATGVDEFALDWAMSLKIPYHTENALWDDLSFKDRVIRTRHDGKVYDAKAGHRRNHKMLMEHKQGTLIAFPGNKGTLDCIRAAKKLNMKIIDVSRKYYNDLADLRQL